MNIQAYIESGILEEYVLGTVSPQEKQEVECMSHIYPEIKEELLRTESALEEYALKHQTAPPASLKESIFAKMNFDSVENQKMDDESAKEDSSIAETLSEDIRNGDFVEIPVFENISEPKILNEPKVINDVFDRQEIVREVTPFWAKLAVAASIIFAVLAGWSAMRISESNTELSELKGDNEKMVADIQTMQKEAEYAKELASMYRDPNFKVVRLAGLDKSPESSVSAFWNQKTNEVMLDVQKLPAAPSGKQYQLWSIVDGKPVDIGMLDDAFSGKVLRMKNTKAGSVAFAITLEKAGGVPSPTMEEMYVMGKV